LRNGLRLLSAMLVAALLTSSCGQAEAPPFNALRAFADLESQVAFGPRVPGSEAHRRCLNWLQEELQKSAPRVVKQSFTFRDSLRDTTLQLANLIASFNLEQKKRIMLCAHWDSRPFADRETDADSLKAVPGANDGASGVSVLLEIARLFAEKPPEIGVDIVLFDGEDWGPEGLLEHYFLGSRYFARTLNGYRPRYAILLDMVGDANLRIPIEYHSQRAAPQVVDKIWDKAEEMGYDAFERRIGSAVNDDHIMLIEAGIPAVNIIDFNYPDASHRYWHTLEDTPDKCSPQSLEIVGNTVLAVVYSEGG